MELVVPTLTRFFERYLSASSIFANKRVLQANYVPEQILHRETELHAVAQVIAPALKGEKSSNLFVYGKPGTGKTLVVRQSTSQLQAVAVARGLPVKVLYVNCKLKRLADTEYRLLAQLAREMDRPLPPTGLPTDEIYRVFFDLISARSGSFILVLDEIDQLVKKTGDELLYNLTRINTELSSSQLSIIGISNDLTFTELLDSRVKSSLSEEEILFAPYTAPELQAILEMRAAQAFKPGVLEQGVIAKCAAYAAREHGDARRAIELLRVAGELCEREGSTSLGFSHIDLAEEKIERDRVLDIVASLPRQSQLVLYGILSIASDRHVMHTGEIYELYLELCSRLGLRPLTQRRVSDMITELDMLGVINARVISKGRHGRTREISLAVLPGTEPKLRSVLDRTLTFQ